VRAARAAVTDDGEQKSTKADIVADVLRHEIAIGTLPVGADLPSEGRLSERFEVSRPSSREALRLLESEGLIRVARGARGGGKVLLPRLNSVARSLGVYLQMRHAKLGDLYAALLTYEPIAARAIAVHRDPAALSALAQCAAAQEYSTHDRKAYGAHERQFRGLLLQLCGNEVIHAMGALLTEVHERTMQHVTEDIASPPWQAEHFASGVAAKHRLVKLMADGEAAKAERAWRAYLTVYWRRVAAHVGRNREVEIYSTNVPPPSPTVSVTNPSRREADDNPLEQDGAQSVTGG